MESEGGTGRRKTEKTASRFCAGCLLYTSRKVSFLEIFKNAGPHIESSGSGPIKKVRAGEVAVGFGLRHQAAADKASGLPIDL